MKNKYFFLAITFSLIALSANQLFAQEITMGEQHRIDSVQTQHKEEALLTQQTKDDNTIADFKKERKETKAKARAAKRIERDADDAAKQVKSAYKAEKRAQRSRRQADKQAERASKAQEKSDKN